MKSFLAILSALSLSLAPGISATTTDFANANQALPNFTYYWNDAHTEKTLTPFWTVSSTNEYKTLFSTSISLSELSNHRLTSIDQIDNISIATDGPSHASMIAIYYEDIYKTEKTFDMIVNSASVTEKISGNTGDYSPEALYKGAQFTFQKWNVLTPANKMFNAEIRIGMTIHENVNSDMRLVIWSSLWVESPPIRSGYLWLTTGTGINVEYNL